MWRDRIVVLFALTLLGTLALGSYWLAERARLGHLSETEKPVRHVVDYFADQFVLHRLDSEGQLRYRVLADRMEHYPDNNTSVLSGHVLIEHQAQRNAVPMQIHTERLTFYPDDDIAMTDRAVQVTQGKSWVTAIGMRLDNTARTLRLYKDVHSTWVHE